MENQQQQPNVTDSGLGTNPISSTPDVSSQAVSHEFSSRKMKSGTLLRIAALAALLFAIIGGSVYAYTTRSQHQLTNNAIISQPSDDYKVQDIPLSDLVDSGSLGLSTTQSLSINGQLRVNNSLSLAPMGRPINGTIGQVYYDKSDNALAYYDGTKFVGVANTDDVANLRSQVQTQLQALQGSIAAVPVQPGDIATLGASNTFTAANTFSGGLSTNNLAVSASAALQGSLSVNGQTTLGSTTIANLLLSNSLGVGSGGTGSTSFLANSVLIGNGSDPVSSVGTTTPDLCLMSSAGGAPTFGICPGGVGSGVNKLNGLMGDLTISNASTAGSIITLNDASAGSKGIASFNATNLTVTSGSVNTVQNISSTATPTFAGLTLTSDLSVSNGGTGASTFTANGILIGNGASAFGSIAAGSAGQCLIATAGAPSFQNCPATPIPANVSSLNGLTGALVLNNSTGSGSNLTINDASTATKGIARFSSTNFTVTGGAVNTIQNIDALSAPTFAGINTGSIASLNDLTVSSAVNKNITLATSGSGALYLSGYDCSASGNGGKLTVDATGKVSCGADGDTDTVGITEIVAGNGIAVSGNQVSVQLQSGYGLAFDAVSPNGLGIQACANNEILKSNGAGWACASDNNTPGDGTGITSIGTLDTGTFSADGASIGGAGSILYLQSASNLNPGLVTIGAQSFAGAKTFNAATLFGAGLSVGSGQNVTLGNACAAGEILSTDVSGVITCVVDNQGTDTNTTYSAGNGLALSVTNEFSTNIRTGFGLQADGNGISLIDTCATGEILKRTAGGWACAPDSEGVDTNTTYTAGNGLTLDGTNTFSTNIRTGFGLQSDSNGIALLEGCSLGEVLKRDATGWVCATDSVGTGDGVGVTVVGAIDSETKSANGAVINGSTIVLQNADSSNGGLVSTAAQTFAGSKTFAAAAIFGGGLSVSTGQTVSLGSACASGQVLTTDSFGVLVCVIDSEGVDTNTTYTAGNGLTLDGTNTFSANIRTGFGLQSDSNGISLIDTCAVGEVLKRTAGGWACGGDSVGSGVTISGTYTDGRLTKFNATGQIMNSNLSESGSTLTYNGNLVVNAAAGFNGNLIDLQLDGVSRFTMNHAGISSFSGLLGAYGGIDTNNQNISAGNGTITGALNSSAPILLNGVDINAGGALTNVAYLNQPNVFGAANTFSTSITTPVVQGAVGGALTLTGNAASTWGTSAGNLTLQAGSGIISLGTTSALNSNGALTVTGGTTLSLRSTTTSAVTLDSGTTGAVNIGNGAFAKTITVGNVTGATTLNLQSGTGGINLVGPATVTGNLIANSGLYTGAGAGTLRLSSAGAFSNVSIPTAGTVTVGSAGAFGVLYADSSNVLQHANINGTYGSTAKCLMTDGTTGIGFGTCPGGASSGYANGGNSYTSNSVSACGTTATTRIATSFDTNILNPALGLCANSDLDLTTNNISRINISAAGDIKILSNSGNSTEKFAVRTQYTGSVSQQFDTLRVDTSSDTLGRVGIGLLYGTAPDVRLDIGGNATSTGSTVNGGLQVRASTAPGLSMNAVSGGGAQSSGRIYFDELSGKFRVSENGGAYVDLIQGSGGAASFLNGGNSFNATGVIGTNDSYGLNVKTNNVTRLAIDNQGDAVYNLNGYFDFKNGASTLVRVDKYNNSLLVGTTTSMGGAGLNVSSKVNATGYIVSGVSGITLSCGSGAQALGAFSFTGGILTSGGCYANNSDLAEAYNSSDNLVAGELVMASGTAATSVNRATDGGQEKLMGIVSTAPGKLLGTEQVPNGYPIALSGRVPTKVNGEGGPISVGDKITISSVAGVGAKATRAGMVVGTAVEAFNGTGIGTIEVFVNLSYYEPPVSELLQANMATIGELNVSGTATINNLSVNNVSVGGALTVTGIATVQSIIVKGHIITASGQPIAEMQNALTGGSAVIDGNDTTGTLTITTGSAPTLGELTRIVFSHSYDKAPRVVLSASNDAAAGLRYFKGNTSEQGFMFNAKDVPASNTVYRFDYFIAE